MTVTSGGAPTRTGGPPAPTPPLRWPAGTPPSWSGRRPGRGAPVTGREPTGPPPHSTASHGPAPPAGRERRHPALPGGPTPPDRPDPGPGREALERPGRGRQGLTDATSRVRGRRCELRQEMRHDVHPAEAAGNGEH